MLTEQEQNFLENLRLYKIDKNLKATNKVFLANFMGNAVVVKQPSLLSTLANALYTLEDKFFFGTRKLSTVQQRFKREVGILKKLEGFYAPQLLFNTNDIIVKEYLFGNDFRTLYRGGSNCPMRNRVTECLEKALEGMYQIHEQGIILGDAHVKNIFFTENRESYWIDFDGVYDESDLEKNKACDLLKFIYSTFSVSRNRILTNYSARIASQYPDQKIKDLASKLIEDKTALELWLPTRIPIFDNFNKEIKKRINP